MSRTELCIGTALQWIGIDIRGQMEEEEAFLREMLEWMQKEIADLNRLLNELHRLHSAIELCGGMK